MANKHTTVLEFEVYGKRNIDALKNALERAGIALELVEDTADKTQRQIHNLSAITKMATARLDNLSSSQKKALKNIIATANLAGRANAPWVQERQILVTAKQVEEEKKLQRELRETERLRRRAERQREESRRALMRRMGVSDSGGADLVGKSVSGPMRVIAYDLVRRSLTEIYALANKVSKSISEWIVDGIKFNDELARSQTFFTSLGILGFKGITGGQMTIAEASVSKDPKVADIYKKSVTNSETVMRKLMAVSAMTGQDLGEIVSATRQSMTDLLNKINKEGKTGTYLQNVDTLNNVTERMVKLASVLRMADPQNRKLSFHMVGLQELFSGTTGTGEKGKKESAGLQNVRSLLMREGIKIGEERARQITQYVNKGNLTAAMDVVQDALERSGLGFEQLANMMNSTLQPAIDGTQMYLRIFNKIFTTDLYNRVLKPFFQATLKHFSLMEQDKVFVGAIEKLGRQFSDVTNDIVLDFARVIDYMTLIPDYSTKEGKAKYSINNKEVAGFFTTQTELQNVISTIGGGAKVMYAIFKIIGNFMMGLMGARDGAQLTDIAKQIEGFGAAAKRFGAQLREAFEWILTAIRTNKLDIFGIITVNLSDFIKVIIGFLVVLKAAKIALSMGSAGKGFIDAIKGIKEEIIQRKVSKVAATNMPQATQKVGILSSIGTVLKDSFSTIINALLLFGGAIKSIATMGWTKLIGLANGFRQMLISVRTFFATSQAPITDILFKKIPQFFSSLFGKIRGSGAATGLKTMLQNLKGLIKTTLTTVVPLIWNSMKSALITYGPRVWGAVVNFLVYITPKLLQIIPQTRIAWLIVSIFIAITPFIIDEIKRNLPAITEQLMKSSAAGGLKSVGFNTEGVPTNKSWNLFNMPSTPQIPETKPVAPKKPLVLMNSQDKTFINIDSLSVNGVQNPIQFTDELKKQARKPEQIKDKGLIDSTFNGRR